MRLIRSSLCGVVLACVTLLSAGGVLLAPSLASASRKEKPKVERTPVAFGSWKGTGSGSFKGALSRGFKKDCQVVPSKKARAIIEGEVKPKGDKGKAVNVTVTVKAAKTGEVVETREFSFSKPSASGAQANRMGRAVAEMARRAPMP